MQRPPPLTGSLVLSVSVFLAASGCVPLPEEDASADSVADPFLDRSSDPDWGPQGPPILSDGFEASESALNLDKPLKDQYPQIAVLLDRAAEISGAVSKAKAAYGVVDTWLNLFAYIEKAPSLEEQISSLHQAINDVADLQVDMHRQELQQGVEDVFTRALRHAGHAFRTGGVIADDMGTEEAMLRAARDQSFERMYRNPAPLWYHSLIPASELAKNGKIWDWRLGLPFLMLHASLRTVVMAAQDRNFGKNPLFASELVDLKWTLHRGFLRMAMGIRCDSRWVNADSSSWWDVVRGKAPAGMIKDAPGPVHVLTDSPANGDLEPMVVACLDIHTGYAIQARALGLPKDRKTMDGIDRIKLDLSTRISAEMPVAALVGLMAKLDSLRE